MFSGCLVPPDNKEIKFGSSDQDNPPSAHKNTGVVLVLSHPQKYVPAAISGGADISEVSWCHMLRQISSHWGSQKLLQWVVCHGLTAYLFFNNFDKFESHNSLKLSFTNIRGLCSNFVDHELFIELNSPDIIAPCETNLDESIDCDNFSLRGYLP